jgi:hypothetical protein
MHTTSQTYSPYCRAIKGRKEWEETNGPQAKNTPTRVHAHNGEMDIAEKRTTSKKKLGFDRVS